MPPKSLFLDLGHQPPQNGSLRRGQILLFIFVQKEQQVKVVPVSQKEI